MNISEKLRPTEMKLNVHLLINSVYVVVDMYI
jgi:hypothetical protein